MNYNPFNFINGVITCLLHYRGKMAKKHFNDLIYPVDNEGNETVAFDEDYLIGRSKADEFLASCLPFTPESLFSNKLLLRADDANKAKDVFDTSKFITMSFDVGVLMRSKHKIGYRKSEVDFLKFKAEQSQSWLFAIAEFDVILAYRTLDEQGFCIVVEVKDGENKFDKAMRIVKFAYEYLGVNYGGGYQGLLPTISTSFSTDVCPFSFDEKFMYGCVDSQGQYFGSFDCKKKLGRAEDIMKEVGKNKMADFSDVELTIPYENEMQFIDERKYEVVGIIGRNIVIKGGMKDEKDWNIPPRQMTFVDGRMQIVYGDVKVDTDNEEHQLSAESIAKMDAEFGSEGGIFTIIDKEGNFKPCNMRKLQSIIPIFCNKGMIDMPLVCFGGYKSKETKKFVESKYVLLQLRDIAHPEQIVAFLKGAQKQLKKMNIVMAFDSPTDGNDLFIVIQHEFKANKYDDVWHSYAKYLGDTLGIKMAVDSIDKDCVIPIPRKLMSDE